MNAGLEQVVDALLDGAVLEVTEGDKQPKVYVLVRQNARQWWFSVGYISGVAVLLLSHWVLS